MSPGPATALLAAVAIAAFLVDRIWVFRQGRIICNRLTRQTSPEEIVGLITGAIDPANLPAEEAAVC